MWWLFSKKGPSGFSATSTAEQVSQGIDASGLTAIITDASDILDLVFQDLGGASSGIGAETARVLALRGVHVVMAIRNISAGRKVQEAIRKEIPNAKVDAMELDLSSSSSIMNFALQFNSSLLPLNLLINNAGVMATPFMLSKDNIEIQFATNHIGHFLLTNLLLETMKKTVRDCGKEGRIVNVSSRRHKFSYPEGICFDRINDKSGYRSLSAYGQSKLANVLHANELSRRLKEDGIQITANSLHPGAIATNLFRHYSFLTGIIDVLGKHVLKSVQQGAATTCYVALHPHVKGVTGTYYADSNIAEPSLQAKDTELAKKLWDFSSTLIHQSNS